jgi:pyridoxal phosphate enzyme (YggS family)
MILSDAINHIQKVIKLTEASCNRPLGSVQLLAVSKKHSVDLIRQAFSLGLTEFAENYYQEAYAKIIKLHELNITWHFIGPVQSNKAQGIARYFNWVHSISRFKTAKLLSEYRPVNLQPLNICLQINISGEGTKSGIRSDQAAELAKSITSLPHLKLRGLMTIPPIESDPQKQYQNFLELQQLMHSLNKDFNLTMDTLSMGMSDDLVPAIKAGATIIRIGRAIFGERI